MRRPEHTPARGASSRTDHARTASRRLIGGSRLSPRARSLGSVIWVTTGLPRSVTAPGSGRVARAAVDARPLSASTISPPCGPTLPPNGTPYATVSNRRAALPSALPSEHGGTARGGMPGKHGLYIVHQDMAVRSVAVYVPSPASLTSQRCGPTSPPNGIAATI